MAKKYLFDLQVDSTALLQANPTEFYSKAMLAQRSTSHFRTLLNIKEKTKIGNLFFDDVLQEADCDFNPTNSNLNAKTMEPCKLDIAVELCQWNLEQSFLADWMKAGNNNINFMPADFSAHYYTTLAEKVSEELEILTWQGDSAGSTETYLDLCDGLEKKLAFAAIPAGQRITGTNVTASNVIVELTKVYNAIPKALRSKRSEIKWFVSTNIAEAYRLAVATASAESYTNKDPELTFLGYQMVVAEGASDNVMALSRGDNFIFLTDLLGDASDMVTVDLMGTTAERKIRTRSGLKFGIDYVNDSEFVVYGIAKQS